MSNKRHSSPGRTAGRAASGFVLGAVVTVASVLVFRSCTTTKTRASTTSATVASAAPQGGGAVAALAGTYDVTIHVTSVTYGSTWSRVPVLSAGQDVTQVWTVVCHGTACAIHIGTGRVIEDPNEAIVQPSSADSWTVEGSTPAAADQPGQPAGCGTVQAADVQKLGLQLLGRQLHGEYVVHRPTLHVEGPVSGGTASCDSFDVDLSITGTRR